MPEPLRGEARNTVPARRASDWQIADEIGLVGVRLDGTTAGGKVITAI